MALRQNCTFLTTKAAQQGAASQLLRTRTLCLWGPSPTRCPECREEGGPMRETATQPHVS